MVVARKLLALALLSSVLAFNAHAYGDDMEVSVAGETGYWPDLNLGPLCLFWARQTVDASMLTLLSDVRKGKPTGARPSDPSLLCPHSLLNHLPLPCSPTATTMKRTVITAGRSQAIMRSHTTSLDGASSSLTST